MRLRMLQSVMVTIGGNAINVVRSRVVDVGGDRAADWISRGYAVEVDPSTPCTDPMIGAGYGSGPDLERGLGFPFSAGVAPARAPLP